MHDYLQINDYVLSSEEMNLVSINSIDCFVVHTSLLAMTERVVIASGSEAIYIELLSKRHNHLAVVEMLSVQQKQRVNY